ncbi:predicted protein [Pyrenophora tritici-repentis Pt-1C-BFP]|uniref:Uncharacterized protein n=1 Tax=Pyrenophora tritici-repentis (strain Pt-1C-BFP) TaxID=426418 RepID=B2VXS0_PYRTR|nr:uncharacterized protein PTRG_03316 [Pyrenophora tritici-repentis Pt-1C-BFP]EDU45839.1 predicted protein [Pyrenophora tritici-repentis Pt-1C-BFP]
MTTALEGNGFKADAVLYHCVFAFAIGAELVCMAKLRGLLPGSIRTVRASTSCVTIFNIIQLCSHRPVDRTGTCVTLKAGITFGAVPSIRHDMAAKDAIVAYNTPQRQR